MKKYKRCYECEKDLSIDDFNRNKSKKDGRQAFCRTCALVIARRSVSKTPKKPKVIQKGSCKVNDTVFYKNKPVLVQNVLDYCPERRKSYISACAIDKSGRPLLGVSVLAGYDWKLKKSF